jgi:hypothetical protein
VQESDISDKVRQSCSSDPFSLQPKQLQPDYLSSYNLTPHSLKVYTKDWRITKIGMEEFGKPVQPVPLNQFLGTFVAWLSESLKNNFRSTVPEGGDKP